MYQASVLKLAGLCFLASLLATAAQAQSTPQEPLATIKTNVRQVLVPVIVTDKSGHYVTDLAPEDFSIFEDGVPQKIVAFSRSPTSLSSARFSERPLDHANTPLANPGQSNSPARTYLICLDTLHSAFDNFAQVRRALKKFFSQEQSGDAQYALIALGWKWRVIVDSTRDPSTILAALNSKALLKTIQDSEAANIASETDRFVHLVGGWCANCPCANPLIDMKDFMCPSLKSQVKASLFSFSERTAILNENFLQQFMQLIEAISSMPTRRTVLFISDGFNRFPGQELYSVLKGFGVNDSIFKFDPRDLQPKLDRVLKLAVQQDIRFYTLDSRGLYTHSAVAGTGQDASSEGAPMAVTHDEMATAWSNGDAMAQLARETGGQFFENNNDLLRGIRKAFADGREEYVLAYVPSNTNIDGQFRRISVELRQNKLRVAAKAGYWATH